MMLYYEAKSPTMSIIKNKTLYLYETRALFYLSGFSIDYLFSNFLECYTNIVTTKAECIRQGSTDLRGLGEIIVAKHRNGATDEVWLRFVGKYAKFQNENEAFEDTNIYNTPALTSFQSRMNISSDPHGAQLDDDIAPF